MRRVAHPAAEGGGGRGAPGRPAAGRRCQSSEALPPGSEGRLEDGKMVDRNEALLTNFGARAAGIRYVTPMVHLQCAQCVDPVVMVKVKVIHSALVRSHQSAIYLCR